MDIEKAYSTHEINGGSNSSTYLLRGIGMAWRRYTILLFTTQKLTFVF